MKSSIKQIPLLSINSTTLTGTYQAINIGGLPFACFLLRIINGGNTAITISYDGTNDHDAVFAASILSVQGLVSAVPNAPGGLFPAGTVVYAKGTAGASGTIAVAGYYQSLS